jgi:hypothetical protein
MRDPSTTFGREETPFNGDSPESQAMSTGPSGAEDGNTTDSSPPSEVRREFWILVGLFNIALLGTGLGVLLLVFEPGADVAWLVLGAGLAAGGYGYGRYRRGERRRADESGRRQD